MRNLQNKIVSPKWISGPHSIQKSSKSRKLEPILGSLVKTENFWNFDFAKKSLIGPEGSKKSKLLKFASDLVRTSPSYHPYRILGPESTHKKSCTTKTIFRAVVKFCGLAHHIWIDCVELDLEHSERWRMFPDFEPRPNVKKQMAKVIMVSSGN